MTRPAVPISYGRSPRRLPRRAGRWLAAIAIGVAVFWAGGALVDEIRLHFETRAALRRDAPSIRLSGGSQLRFATPFDVSLCNGQTYRVAHVGRLSSAQPPYAAALANLNALLADRETLACGVTPVGVNAKGQPLAEVWVLRRGGFALCGNASLLERRRAYIPRWRRLGTDALPPFPLGVFDGLLVPGDAESVPAATGPGLAAR